MKHKELLTLILFLTSFIVFLNIINPDITSFNTISTCSDYIEKTTCASDFECEWEDDQCVDLVLECTDHIDQITCELNNCNWHNNEVCIEEIVKKTDIIQDRIDIIVELQADPENTKILEAMDIDLSAALTNIYNLDLQIQQTEEDTVLTQEEKTSMLLNLEQQLDNLVLDLPQEIDIKNKITAIPTTPVSDITPVMLPRGLSESDIDEIYKLQDQIEARTNIIVFYLKKFSGEEILGTILDKSITAPISDGYILDLIPITVLPYVDFLIIDPSYEVIKGDPVIIKIPAPSGQTTYSYTILDDISGIISQIQTAAIPYTFQPAEAKIKTICGDGICTEFLEDEIICPQDCARKIPWLLIMVLGVIFIIIIIILTFFRDQVTEITIDIKNVFIKKEDRLFKSKKDRINLRNYVRNALKEGIAEDKLRTILLAKKWKDKQINSIMDKVKKGKQEKPKEKKKEILKKKEEKKEISEKEEKKEISEKKIEKKKFFEKVKGIFKKKEEKIEKKKEFKKLKKKKLKHKIKKTKEKLFETEKDKVLLKKYIDQSLQKHINKDKIKSVLKKQGWTDKQINSVMKKETTSQFKDENVKKQLKDYVNKSLQQGVSEQQIRTALKQKNWKDEQLNEVFNELKTTKTSTTKLFQNENVKQQLKDYVNKSLKQGVSEQQIKTALKQKNWTDEQINEVFSEVKKESTTKEVKKETKKHLFKSKEEKEELKNKVKKLKKQGKKKKEIKPILEKEGYNEKQINKVIKEIKIENLFKSEEQEKELKKTVKELMDEGAKEEEVKEELLKQDYTEEQIDYVLEEEKKPKLEDKLNKSKLEEKIE